MNCSYCLLKKKIMITDYSDFTHGNEYFAIGKVELIPRLFCSEECHDKYYERKSKTNFHNYFLEDFKKKNILKEKYS